ncbi:MAG: hypothetical protein QM733_03745 [Ilumatobacteraceae bacterium]
MPTVIVGTTIKGKGVDFMENEQAWHAGTINAETLEACCAALDARHAAAREEVSSWAG